MTEPTVLVIEADDSILDAPRTLLAETFCEWLVEEDVIQGLPPGEIVVTITPDERVGAPYGDDTGVACFALALGPFLNRRWEVVIAYGEDYMDSADVESWLTSITHELLHLVDFARTHGERLPADVGAGAIRAVGGDARNEDDEDRIENLARRISTRFVLARPNACEAVDLLTGGEGVVRPRARAR